MLFLIISRVLKMSQKPRLDATCMHMRLHIPVISFTNPNFLLHSPLYCSYPLRAGHCRVDKSSRATAVPKLTPVRLNAYPFICSFLNGNACLFLPHHRKQMPKDYLHFSLPPIDVTVTTSINTWPYVYYNIHTIMYPYDVL